MTTSTQDRVTILADIFRRAVEAADTMRETDDGGTCNFDSPAFRVARMSVALIRRAAAIAGVGVYAFQWTGRQRWYWLQCTAGQGDRRARMTTAAVDVLRAAVDAGELEGLEARGYYAMD